MTTSLAIAPAQLADAFASAGAGGATHGAGMPGVHGAGMPSAQGASAQAGYGISLNDVATFEKALNRASAATARGLQTAPVTVTAAQSVHPPGEAMQALFKPLEQINTQAAQLSAEAHAALVSGRALTPGEMVMLTVKSQEFMFHCQLTANVANRTSDGLSQLFRQQA